MLQYNPICNSIYTFYLVFFIIIIYYYVININHVGNSKHEFENKKEIRLNFHIIFSE